MNRFFTKRKRREALFSLGEACTGILASGRPGSGKSTCLKRIVPELVDQGVKFTVMCAKPDEAATYKDILPDAVVLKPGTEVLNPIEYELSREGGSVRNLAMMLEDLGEILNRSSSDKGETFWKDQTSQAIRNAIEACVAAGHGTFKEIYDFLTSTPADMEQAGSET